MQNVVSVGFPIPSSGDNYIRFNRNASLSDADIVIFDSDISEMGVFMRDFSIPEYHGMTCYSLDDSYKIKKYNEHWKIEIKRLLESGRTVFILLSEKKEFFLQVGETITGTGKGRIVDKTVTSSDNYEFLPISNLKIHNANGSKIHAQSPLIKPLFECCQEVFQFQSYIEIGERKGELLFATRNKEKVLGASLNILNGHVVFIPSINFPDKFYTSKGWSNEAIAFGHRFKSCLVEISTSLKGEAIKTPMPDWVGNKHFHLVRSENIMQEININLDAISKLTSENESLQIRLKEEESLKDLLFESGKPLEQAVIRALKLLGYKAENYDDGDLELDQIITSPENDRFIGECEGKDSKDIDISKFRQLLDALNEDFAREEITEKASGILFGNPQRLTAPDERSLDFTDKCKRAAERERIALVKTADLFVVAKYLSAHDDEAFRIACRKAITSQFGSIVQFPVPPVENEAVDY